MNKTQRQFVQHTFYKADTAWRFLSDDDRTMGKREFLAVCDEFSQVMPVLKSYSLVGIRGDVDFMLWKVSDDLETLHALEAHLSQTILGKWLHSPYVYLAMTKESIYLGHHRDKRQEGRRNRVVVHDSKYLFVYPFVKTRSWYSLTSQERRRMMAVHFKVGHKFPLVKIHTTYSYGLDDQEFVLGFETDSPADLLDLVMALRETEASSYTERDTPIFTCLSMELSEVLDSLGG